MYEAEQVIENLVIQVQTRSGSQNNNRRVIVPSTGGLLAPARVGSSGGMVPMVPNSVSYHNSAPLLTHPWVPAQASDSQHHSTNNATTSTNNTTTSTKSRDGGSTKKPNTRHSYHSQPPANGSVPQTRNSTNSSALRGSTNGSTPQGKGPTNSSAGSSKTANNQYSQEGNRRAPVARERSFVKHQNQHYNNGPLQDGNTHVTRGVQRQRSCVANLYGTHGRSHSVAMPAATAYQRPKPAMQLYRPPTLRVTDDYSITNGTYAYDGGQHDAFNKPGLNINAKEFVSLSSNGTPIGYVTQNSTNGGVLGGNTVSFSGPNGLTTSALKHSKSSSHVIIRQNGIGGGMGLHHSKSGGKLAKEGRNGVGILAGSSPPLRVHFTDDTIAYDPDNKVGMIQRSPTNHLLTAVPIKRSKSLGSAADLNNLGSCGGGLLVISGDTSAATASAINAIADMAPFTEDVSNKLTQVVHDPNVASSRLVMEVVRQLFDKLVQATRYAEPAARYCIAVIEKESDRETFLETLLNTCQEFYQERDTLLRFPSSPRSAGPPTHTKWVAYMTFLHEMYTQVKRRQRTVVSATAPGMLLLTLLGECCVVSLEDQAKGGAAMSQTECLFFILTGVGKDIEVEIPPLMSKVMGAARDALFASARAPAVRKTLLQLIEMNAASWQLPAPAVMYYYPGVGAK